MPAIATFPSALDAELDQAADGSGKRSAQVIGVAVDDADAGLTGERLMFLVVDHEGHGHLIAASRVTFKDDKVMPPKYG